MIPITLPIRWIRHRPLRCGTGVERDDGMIMAVQIKPEITLAVALAVPAIFLDGKIGLKIIGRIKVEAFGQGRIEK